MHQTTLDFLIVLHIKSFFFHYSRSFCWRIKMYIFWNIKFYHSFYFQATFYPWIFHPRHLHFFFIFIFIVKALLLRAWISTSLYTYLRKAIVWIIFVSFVIFHRITFWITISQFYEKIKFCIHPRSKYNFHF